MFLRCSATDLEQITSMDNPPAKLEQGLTFPNLEVSHIDALVYIASTRLMIIINVKFYSHVLVIDGILTTTEAPQCCTHNKQTGQA